MTEIAKRHPIKRVLANVYILIILIAVFVFFALLSGGKFVGAPSILNIIRVAVPSVMLASVATLLMVTGNVDLSVGGMMGLVACVFAILMQQGVPFYAGMVLVALMACGLGYINGFMVMKLNITPVIATLATMSLYQGVAKLLVPPKFDIIKGGMPDDMNFFARGKLFLDIPPSVLVAVALVAIFVILQKKTTLGKYSVAIGGNRTAAQLSGINVVKTVWLVYVFLGMAAGLAGVTRASYMQAGDPDSGIGIEVEVILAILLGGASFSGGRGSILKTVAAVFVLISLDKGLTLIGVESYWAMLVKGIVFIGVLAFVNVLGAQPKAGGRPRAKAHAVPAK